MKSVRLMGVGIYGGKHLWKRRVLAYNEKVKVWWMMTVEVMKMMKVKKIDYVKLRASYPSVCASVRPAVLLSVTLRYCVKTREHRKMRSSPVSLIFWCQEWGRPCSGKIWVQKRSTPAAKNSRDVHISPHNSGTVTDNEKCRSCQLDSGLSINKPLTKVVHHL